MNKLLKTLVFDDCMTLSVLDTTEMVNDAIKIHNLSPVCAAALGRTLTICTFMSSFLKGDKEKLSVTVAGDGLGGKITVSGNGNLQMRGYMDNPAVDLPLNAKGKLDVSGCVGKKGRITVVRSMGLKEPYVGTSRIVTGEIAEDFTAYYALSEQMPTAMALGVKIGKDGSCVGAGGVIIQALPGVKDEHIDKAESVINSLSNLSTLIELKGAEEILKDYFNKTEYEIFYPKYECLCSREYLEGILVSLGQKELKDIIEKDGKIKVDCEYCKKSYIFTEQDVEKLFR
ncbi:MAG: Hsp33 family molecular chaperone HslO [Clostridia bacterium]|nr:Hsp33 family molecular chaperone HslO [Clostridia bacterium]